MLNYDFKFLQELAWIAVVAAVTALGAELLTFNQAVLDDPLTWGYAVLGAVGRAAVAAIVAKLSPNGGFSLR